MLPPIRQHRFHQVDVFPSGAFSGNPLAVVHAADGLTDDEMLQFTRWTNLSEATFLLPPIDPTADYRVRIFFPGGELPFAGHPTLGTCRAWLESGGVPQRPGVIVQECGVGLVPIRADGDRLAFAAPPLRRSGLIEPSLLAERLDQLGLTGDDIVDAAWIDNGPGWMGILLPSADAVLDVALPGVPIAGFDVGLIGPYEEGAECALEVRGLFSDAGHSVREDPVTGSLNASVAQWLIGSGRVSAPYVASQGAAIGRAGRIHVIEADGEIWIGGRAIVRVAGTVDL